MLFGLGIPIFLYGASQIALTDLIGDWLAFGTSICLAIGTFIVWPGTLSVDRSELRETRWLGMRRISIPWRDVDYVFGSPAEGILQVVDQRGRQITHSKYHVAPDVFAELLAQYCKKYVRA